MDDLTQWAVDNGLLVVRPFDDGMCGAIVPMTFGKYRIVIGPQGAGWHDDLY